MRLHKTLAQSPSTTAWLWAAALLCTLASTPSRALAQDEYGFTAAGLQAGHTYASQLPFERIDPYSGSLILSFTDVTLPGNAGMDLRWVRTFNSNPVGASVLTAGSWSFGLAGIPMVVYSPDTAPGPGLLPPPPVFITPDGASHTGMYPPGLDTTEHLVTSDFWEYDRTAHRLLLPNAWVVHYDRKDGTVNRRYPTLVEDPFGNALTFEYDESAVPSRLVAVHQVFPEGRRTLTLAYEGALVSSVSYAGRTWSYSYDTTSHSSPVLRFVTPPIGPGWEYQYSNYVPVLHKVITPGGGEVTYAIVGLERPGGPQSVETRVVASRSTAGPDVQPGTWTFEYGAGGNPFTITTSIAGPHSTTSYEFVTDLNSPARGRAQEITVSAGGSILRHEHLEWAAGPRFGFDYAPGRVPLLTSHAVTQDGETFTTTYSYGTSDFADYGHPAQIVESGGLGRTVVRSYEHLVRKGALTEETTTVNGESFTAHYDIDSTTGILEHESVLGIDRDFGSTNGNITSETDAHGHTTTYEYTWGTLSAVIPPVTDMTIVRGINEDGTVAWEQRIHDGTWVQTTFEYDALGRPTWVQPPVGNGTTTIYDDEHRTIRTERGDFWTFTIADGFGHPGYSVNALGVRNEKWYDADFRLIYDSYPFYAPDNVGDFFEFDPLNRPTRRIHTGDATYTETSYGPGTVSLRDENGRTTTQHWQSFTPGDGRLTGVTDAAGQTWAYTYNGLGSLTSVVAPDGIPRAWSYDARNLLQSETHPESGTVIYGYDAAGQLRTKTDANQNTFTYFYDANERLVRMTVGGRETTIGYEAGSDLPAILTAENIATTFAYDAAGRPTRRTDALDGLSFTSTYEYNGNDDLQAIVYPTGRRVQYELDSGGRPTRVFDGSTHTDYATDFGYHATGAINSYKTGNGIVHATTYDPLRYRLLGIDAGNLHLTYANYDHVGNVGAILDARPGMNQTFSYDSLDRLASSAGPYGTSAFAYDAHGNRRNAGGSTYTYQPGTLRLTGQNGQTFAYDANGNMTSAAGATYDYNRENRMESSTVGGVISNFLYDADGWRVRQSTGSTVTRSLRGPGGELLTEWTGIGADSVASDSIYAAGRLVAVAKRVLPPAISVSSLSANVTFPVQAGTPVTWTVAASGGLAPLRYRFWMDDGTSWAIKQDWSTSNTFVWTPTVAGTYGVAVWAHSSGAADTTYEGTGYVPGNIITAAPPISVSSLSSNVTFPVQVGTPVTWTVAASGGLAPRRYRFWLDNGTSWTIAQDWSTSNTLVWTPTVAGTYGMAVWVSSAGAADTTYEGTGYVPGNVVTAAPPISVSSLSSNVTFPVVAGTPVTWTVAASGGVAPRRYRFWLDNGTSWTIAQDWSTSNTLIWTPTVAGTYGVAVWVSSAGAADTTYEATGYVPGNVVTAAPPITVSSLSSNVTFPVQVGTHVTWTAAASGGLAPRRYRFWLDNGTSWTIAQDWSTSNTLVWTPTVAGTYGMAVWVSSAGAADTTYEGTGYVPGNIVTAAPPITVSSLSSNVTFPVVAGTPVTWTVAASGGVAPRRYRFWLDNGTSWTIAQDWSTSNTLVWTPIIAGTYGMAVWVSSAGAADTTYEGTGYVPGNVVTTAPPVSVSSLSPNVTFPVQVGTHVTWTAAASGGTAPLSYRFYVYDGTSWQMKQDYSTSATFNWTPTAAGTCYVEVWVRGLNSTAAFEAWRDSSAAVVTTP